MSISDYQEDILISEFPMQYVLLDYIPFIDFDQLVGKEGMMVRRGDFSTEYGVLRQGRHSAYLEMECGAAPPVTFAFIPRCCFGQLKVRIEKAQAGRPMYELNDLSKFLATVERYEEKYD